MERQGFSWKPTEESQGEVERKMPEKLFVRLEELGPEQIVREVRKGLFAESCGLQI